MGLGQCSRVTTPFIGFIMGNTLMSHLDVHAIHLYCCMYVCMYACDEKLHIKPL